MPRVNLHRHKAENGDSNEIPIAEITSLIITKALLHGLVFILFFARQWENSAGYLQEFPQKNGGGNRN